MALETLVDHLPGGYGQLEPGTFIHADQLMAAQVRSEVSLGNILHFFVADGVLYSLEGKEQTPTLWLTRESDNLVLRHLNDKDYSSYDHIILRHLSYKDDSSYNQLFRTGNFRPSPEEARQAMEAKGTLRVDLTKLNLQGNDAEWRYLEINTVDYDTLNAEEKKLAERFYGQGEAFVTAMKTLKEAGSNQTGVNVLNPTYVSKEAQEGPIGRTSLRGHFINHHAYSSACGNGVNGRGALCGVRRQTVS